MKKSFVYSDSSKKKKIIIFIAILLFLFITIYFNFLYTRKCSNAECFNSALAGCKRAEHLNKKDDSTWHYLIKGARGDKCIVDVKNLWINLEEAKTVQEKSMACYLPKGVVMQPESDLGGCHGLLKEALQDIIIERLHTYVVQNIGQITSELEKPI